MKYLKLIKSLKEDIRTSDLKPRPVTDPNTPEGKVQQQVRDAGDVGKREMLQKVTGKPVKTASQFRQAARQVYNQSGAGTTGDGQDPVDRVLTQVAGPAQYDRELEAQAKSEREALGKAPTLGKEPPKFDARGNISKRYLNYQERQREIAKYNKALDAIQKKVDDADFDSLPTAERIKRQADANLPFGRMSPQGEAEDMVDAVTKLSLEPEAREPAVIETDVEVPVELRADPNNPFSLAIPDSPDSRHRFQKSGMEMGVPEEDPDYVDPEDPGYPPSASDKQIEKRDPNAFSDYELDIFTQALVDPERFTGTLSPEAMSANTGKDVDKQQTATEKDLETIFRDDQRFTKALETEDAETLQDIAFTRKDVSDEDVNRLIDRFDASGAASQQLVTKLKTRGLGKSEKTDKNGKKYMDDRERAAYGGEDLFPEGEVPDQFKPKIYDEDKGEWVIDKDAPHGVYDLVEMGRLDPQKRKQAINTRGFEAIRTYMKQEGRDVYARHEGMRSIGNMDLEHLRALKSDQPDGKRGYDHPKFWAWSQVSGNRRRGERPLTTMSQALDQGNEVTTVDTQVPKQTYDSLMARILGPRPTGRGVADERAAWEDLKRGLQDELGPRPTKGRIEARSEEERLQEIERLVAAGATEEEAEAIAGKVETSRNPEGFAINPFKHGSASRQDGRPLVSNPQYGQDVSTDMRDHRMYRKSHALIQKIPAYSNMELEQIKSTPEARRAALAIRNMTQPAAVPDQQAAQPAPAPVEADTI